MEINVKGENKVEPKEAASPPTFLNVKLLRHWTPDPDEDVRVIGYKKPAVIVRMSTGGTYEAEPEKFVANEMAPPPVTGVTGLSSSWENDKYIEWVKIWAGTYLELDANTAYDLIDKGAAQMVRPL